VKTLLPGSFWPSVYKWTTSGTWPPATAESASLLIERCSWHGLLPLLFAETDLPPLVEQARAAASGWRRILGMRADWFHEAILAVCALLADEPAILIKGADYAHRLYPSGFLRPMEDIDILVLADRIDATCERLTGAGLVRLPEFGAARDPAHHERVFSLGKVLVEVHQSFIQRPRHRIDYDGIWRRRVPAEIGGRRAFRLDDVDALIYQALTISLGQFHVGFIRYVDLWLLLRQGAGIALAAAERSREWQTTRALYGALSMGCRLFPEFRTDDVSAAMEHALPAATRRFVDRWVLPRPSELQRITRPSRALQLWRKAFLMDTPRRRLAFALSHAVATVRSRRSE